MDDWLAGTLPGAHRRLVTMDRAVIHITSDFLVDTVRNSNSGYLKLHIENNSDASAKTDEVPGLESFCHAFEDVTGWSLRKAGASTTSDSQVSDYLLPPTGEDCGFVLQPASLPTDQKAQAEAAGKPLELGRARPLAESMAEVLQELQNTRLALLQREADLAAGVPVAARHDEEAHLAMRLEAILKGGAQAIGCQAAAVYMLDEATTELNMRSSWGLPNRCFLAPARPLRGSVADLEALIGHAVVIEDAHLLPHWKVPEPYAAAICVPVSSPTEPLGTLWMFTDDVTDFSEAQTNLVEIIADRISSELQREMLLTECVSSKQVDRQLVRAAEWQRDHQPNVVPLLDDWRLVGWTSESPMLNSGFFDWFVPQDGSLTVTLGHGDGPMIQSALTAATLQSSIRSHAQHIHDTRKLIGHVNETLWNSSAGGDFASMFIGKIDPDTGVLEYCSAGEAGALLVGTNSVTSLVSPSLPLASEPDNNYQQQTAKLEPGDHLVLFKPTTILPGADDIRVMDPQMLADKLQGALSPNGNMLDIVCAAIEDLAPAADHAVLIVHRLPTN
jgi:hypothetical protein